MGLAMAMALAPLSAGAAGAVSFDVVQFSTAEEMDLAFSVDGAGDVNGDGHADLLIGIGQLPPDDLDSYGYSFRGGAYLVWGRPKMPAEIALDQLPAEHAFTMGLSLRGERGVIVAGIGDFHGDQLDDVLVWAGGPGHSAGTILFGNRTKPRGLIDLDTLPPAQGLLIGGLAADDSGFEPEISISAAGDHNGDGLADLLIGSNRLSQVRKRMVQATGGAILLLGRKTGGKISLDEPGWSGYRMIEDGGDLMLGDSVAGVGDTNGDGYADLLIGSSFALPLQHAAGGEGTKPTGETIEFPNAPGVIGRVWDSKGDEHGSAFLVHGGVALAEIGLGAESLRIDGDRPKARVGRSVAAAGDVNGDGLADMLVGSLLDAWVIFGRKDMASVDLQALDGQGFLIEGGGGGEWQTRSLAGVGDVNGDGLDDVVVATADGVFLVFGKRDNRPVSLLGSGPGVIKLPVPTAPRGGIPIVAAAHDVDGNGTPDILIGHGSLRTAYLLLTKRSGS